MLYTATDSCLARFSQLAWDALSSDEAIALYCEALTITRDAGNGLRRFSESIALGLLHGLAFFATLLVWGLVEFWGWAKAEAPRFVADLREAIATAVADAQAEPLALPWSADVPAVAEAEPLAWVMPCATDWAMLEAGLTG